MTTGCWRVAYDRQANVSFHIKVLHSIQIERIGSFVCVYNVHKHNLYSKLIPRHKDRGSRKSTTRKYNKYVLMRQTHK